MGKMLSKVDVRKMWGSAGDLSFRGVVEGEGLRVKESRNRMSKLTLRNLS